MSEANDIREWRGRSVLRSVLALLAGMLSLLLGAGPAIASGSGHDGAGPAAQLRPAPLLASVFTRPAAPPSRAVTSNTDGRAATRNARGADQAEAVAAHLYRAATVQHPGAEPDPAASPRLRWLRSQLLAQPASAVSRLPAGLPSGRAPPRSART